MSELRLSNETKRYLIIGVSVYLFELLVIVTGTARGLSGVTAVALAFWSGLLLSFLLQKIITFDDKRFAKKIVGLQLLGYSALVLFNFCFTVVVTKLLASFIPAFVCRTLALGVTTMWNFYLYKTHIFKVNPNEKFLD